VFNSKVSLKRKAYSHYKPKKEVSRMFGQDIFKVLAFAIRIIRLLFEVFGDEKDRELVVKSKERSVNHSEDEPC